MKWKYAHDKNVNHVELNTKIECYFKYDTVKDDAIVYKCFCCNKNYKKKYDEDLKMWFACACNFSNHDINKFILVFRKGVYPYKYMDDWEKSNKIFPEKEDFS